MLYLSKSRELAARHTAIRLLVARSRNHSNGNDSSDDKRELESKMKTDKSEKLSNQVTDKPNEEESASSKLNRLLASMQTVDNQTSFIKRDDIVAKPGGGNKKLKLQQKQESESKDIFAAAKKVAALLGDEKPQKQTESELLTRLLGGKPLTANVTSEEQTLTSNEGNFNLSELIVGMKIDRRQQTQEINTRSEYVRRMIAAKGRQQQYKKKHDFQQEKRPIQRRRDAELYTGTVNLYGGEPLGIFTDPCALKDSIDLLPTWKYLDEQALKIQVSHPPSNYFDKLARWTEQGKIWRFPIDNEQDWLDEKDVDFSEHIFLEQHLEGWCPTRGPVRHFMELVCVGLSKNPFITAKEKKDHIMWYKNYFESKKDILRELISKDPKVENNSQLERKIEA